MTTSVGIEGPGLSSSQLKLVFPFHIAIDSNFNVTQIGEKLEDFQTLHNLKVESQKKVMNER